MIRRAFMATIRKLKFVVEDVFATKTYNGSSGANVITTGVDLTKGGLVITKRRNSTTSWSWLDTVRGTTQSLSSDTTAIQGTVGGVASVSTTGYTLDYTGSNDNKTNASGGTYAAWTFRKAAKFFDVKTFTATNGLVVSHDLGVAPGVVIIKRTTATSNWFVFHRDMSTFGTQYVLLDSSSGYTNNGTAFTASSTALTISTGGSIVNGGSYVAYMFGHDTTSDGIIRCGKYTGTSTSFYQYYYSNNSITIPAGVSSIKATIHGGDGYQTYNAGQGNASYPSGLPPYQAEQIEWYGAPNGTVQLDAYDIYGNPLGYSVTVNSATDRTTFENNLKALVPGYGSGTPGYYENLVINFPQNGNSSTPNASCTYMQVYIQRNDGYSGYYYANFGAAYQPYKAQVGNSSYPSGLPTYIAPYYTDQYGTTTSGTLNGTTESATYGYGTAPGSTNTYNMFKPIESASSFNMTVGSPNGYVRVEYYYSGTGTVNLGWEPQFLLIKSMTTTGDWYVIDNSRGADYPMSTNLTTAEINFDAIDITSTGFTTRAGALSRADDDYIYIAIRKGPMR